MVSAGSSPPSFNRLENNEPTGDDRPTKVSSKPMSTWPLFPTRGDLDVETARALDETDPINLTASTSLHARPRRPMPAEVGSPRGALT